MGILDKLRGTGSDEVDAAVAALRAGLPGGWSYGGFRDQLIGRRPVKHRTYGIWAKGPDGIVAALSLDPMLAVQELGRLVHGTAGQAPADTWAPPPLDRSGEEHREPWAPLTDSDEEAAARDELEKALPPGAVLSPLDQESFGPFTVYAFTAHLADGQGVAAMSLEAMAAYAAMAERLRGELTPSPTWFLRR
jgi:hypothetical protein